jgi:hypothetical protein
MATSPPRSRESRSPPEFTQATVDILLRDRSPSDRDEVLLTVQQRMEKFHGKK